jgi:DNA-binding IclR family transcriptional regulator
MSSVVRSLQILEKLTDARRSPTHSELAHTLKIPKSTLSQILEQLVEANFIYQADRRYYANIRLLLLARKIAMATDARSGIRSVMDRVAVRTGETVLLGTMAGNHLVQIEQSPSPQPIRYVTEVGTPQPLHCTAGGKVLLAFNKRSARSLGRLSKLTERTVTDPAQVDLGLEAVREQGYAMSIGETVADVTSIAAPIVDADGDFLAVLTVVGPSRRIKERIDTTVPVLLQAAEEFGGLSPLGIDP